MIQLMFEIWHQGLTLARFVGEYPFWRRLGSGHEERMSDDAEAMRRNRKQA